MLTTTLRPPNDADDTTGAEFVKREHVHTGLQPVKSWDVSNLIKSYPWLFNKVS